MKTNGEYEPVDIIYLTSTRMAILVQSQRDRENKTWLPRSCIHSVDEQKFDSEIKRGDEATVRVFLWLAKKGNLI